MKRLLLVLMASTLALTSCASSKPIFSLPLSPVPYLMKVDASLVTHLTVEIPNNDFAKTATKAGAKAQVLIYYTPATGAKVIFMSVYLFPAKVFDRLKNPNEPPAYGQEVIRRNGDVLSVAGPSDSIFDPKSKDGKNISALYETIYKAATYKSAL
jgi:hypothetical protein